MDTGDAFGNRKGGGGGRKSDPTTDIWGNGKKTKFNYDRVNRYKPKNQNSFYNPDYNYGSPWGKGGNRDDAFLKTGWGNQMIQSNPEAYYNQRLSHAGLGTDATTLMGRFFRSQYDESYRGYEQAKLSNPFLTYKQYFKTTGGAKAIEDAWQMASPQARGENLGLTQGPARWQIPY